MAKNNDPLPLVQLEPEVEPSPSVITQTIESATDQGVVYKDPAVGMLLKTSVHTNKYKEVQPKVPAVSDGMLLTDIAQSHHYTVYIQDFNMSKFKLPNGAFSEGNGFLPVKTINLTYTSYENMSIPLAIFGDFPLLNKKRVSTISLSCYDTDNNELEKELRIWEAKCFPQGRYVAYMDDIARNFIYRGYNVKGKKTLEYSVYVIPSGSVTVSRDYGANDAKMVNFSLVCVGDGQTCATGNGGDIPIVDHGGAGDGRTPATRYHDVYLSGYQLDT